MAINIRKLPWHAILQGGYFLRRLGFSKDHDDKPGLTAEASTAEVKRMFMREHLNSGWLFSYHYFGEDANLRRGEHGGDKLRELILDNEIPASVYNEVGVGPKTALRAIAEIDKRDEVAFQFHARVFDGDREHGEAYCTVKPHHELDALVHPKGHLKGEGMNVIVGMLLSAYLLDKRGFSYSATQG